MNIYLGDSGNIGSLSHHWRGIIVILSKLTANNREREKERQRERTADRFSEEIACRFSAEPLWNLKNTFRSLCTEQARHSRHSQKYTMTSLTLSLSLSLPLTLLLSRPSSWIFKLDIKGAQSPRLRPPPVSNFETIDLESSLFVSCAKRRAFL